MSQFLGEKTRNAILHYVPKGEVLDCLANYFQAYADRTRIKILSALSITELCVGDISEMLEINQTTVSHQLKFLKTFGAVASERDGKIIYYSIKSNTINDVMLNGVNYLLQA